MNEYIPGIIKCECAILVNYYLYVLFPQECLYQVQSSQTQTDKARACDWAVEGGGVAESFREERDEEDEQRDQRKDGTRR